jgi:BlaI family transcriptional regulator, penicillinase repressor
MADTRLKPTDVEMQVLSVLWQNGPSTARQVLQAMPDRKIRAYTTVLTVMQVMEKKGLLSHTRQGMAHIYKPKVTKRDVLRPMMRGLVERIFGGSTSAAVQQLLSETDVTADELAKIREMLRDHERGRGGK